MTGRQSKEVGLAVTALKKGGITIAEAATRYGVARSTLYRALLRADEKGKEIQTEEARPPDKQP